MATPTLVVRQAQPKATGVAAFLGLLSTPFANQVSSSHFPKLSRPILTFSLATNTIHLHRHWVGFRGLSWSVLALLPTPPSKLCCVRPSSKTCGQETRATTDWQRLSQLDQADQRCQRGGIGRRDWSGRCSIPSVSQDGKTYFLVLDCCWMRRADSGSIDRWQRSIQSVAECSCSDEDYATIFLWTQILGVRRLCIRGGCHHHVLAVLQLSSSDEASTCILWESGLPKQLTRQDIDGPPHSQVSTNRRWPQSDC